MNIIITGNIGCGKSTISRELIKHFPKHKLYSVDAMVHEMYDDPAFKQYLQNTFGTVIRSQVSDIVFADPEKRKSLEDRSMLYLTVNISTALNRDGPAILEFPLYFEMGRHYSQGPVVAVTCSDAVQMERVKARDNFSEEKIQSIKANQFSTDLKAAMSDYVIANDGGDITASVRDLAIKLKTEMLEERAIEFFHSKDIWNAIHAAYTESHRHYHTLEHLVNMFDLFDEHITNIPHPWAVEMAIWFHDFVYDTNQPQYASNEANSVKAMLAMLNPKIPGWPNHDLSNDNRWLENRETLMLAAEFIMSTKGHKIKAAGIMADDAKRLSNEYFLDIDLSILGASKSICDAFDNNIRKEFAQYPDDQFAKGRAQAMYDFKQRARVFYTDEFHQKHNDYARKNLKTIISKWSHK